MWLVPQASTKEPFKVLNSLIWNSCIDKHEFLCTCSPSCSSRPGREEWLLIFYLCSLPVEVREGRGSTLLAVYLGTTVTEGVARASGFPVRALASPGHCQEYSPRMLQVLAPRKVRPLVNPTWCWESLLTVRSKTSSSVCSY